MERRVRGRAYSPFPRCRQVSVTSPANAGWLMHHMIVAPAVEIVLERLLDAKNLEQAASIIMLPFVWLCWMLQGTHRLTSHVAGQRAVGVFPKSDSAQMLDSKSLGGLLERVDAAKVASGGVVLLRGGGGAYGEVQVN